MRFFPVLLTLLLAFHARATPYDPANEMNHFVADYSLLNRIDPAEHGVGLKTSELVFNAMSFLGVPYREGGSTGETGFDCSGFVRTIFSQTAGKILPRRSEQQAAATQKIAQTELEPGDLVFFNTMRRAFSHVGIYVGEGRFIHSPKPGGQVRLEEMAMSYWKRRFNGARRVDKPLQVATDSHRHSMDFATLPAP